LPYTEDKLFTQASQIYNIEYLKLGLVAHFYLNDQNQATKARETVYTAAWYQYPVSVAHSGIGPGNVKYNLEHCLVPIYGVGNTQWYGTKALWIVVTNTEISTYFVEVRKGAVWQCWE
jgi:hypothetical protein